jgi:hypothetical protein
MKTSLAVKIIQQLDEETAKSFLQSWVGEFLVKREKEDKGGEE